MVSKIFEPLKIDSSHYFVSMASRFTIYSINQISDLLYQIPNIIYKISDILYQILYKLDILYVN